VRTKGSPARFIPLLERQVAGMTDRDALVEFIGFPDRHLGGTAYDDPVLGAVVVHLHRQLAARINRSSCHQG
jgi:hypothetical protein